MYGNEIGFRKVSFFRIQWSTTKPAFAVQRKVDTLNLTVVSDRKWGYWPKVIHLVEQDRVGLREKLAEILKKNTNGAYLVCNNYANDFVFSLAKFQ
jgi:hypothetical protein